MIEDLGSFTMEISRYQKYGKLLKNSVESYPVRERIVFVMNRRASVEQAVVRGTVRFSLDSYSNLIILKWMYCELSQ